ncbi:OmpH family outer membrane protein [Parasalinivibrio latis]
MNRMVKAAGLSLAIISASFYAQAADAAQKIGYVATNQAMQQLAKQSNLGDKLRKEFKDRIDEVKRLEEKAKTKVDKLKRNGELMSADERTKLQREIQSMESDFKLKVQALQEDQRRRGAEEEQKLVKKLKDAINAVAKKEGYDMVIDANAVLYAKPSDDLSAKVIKAVK